MKESPYADAARGIVVARTRRRPRRRPRTHASARRRAREGEPGVHPGRPDREGGPDDDEDRVHAARRGSRSTRSSPSPGWTRSVQQTGAGEGAVITKVTWTGGDVPTGEDARVPVPRRPRAKTYTFDVQQTYSDGSVVDWSGPEPRTRPRRQSRRDSLGGGGGSTLRSSRSSLGGLGVLLGGPRARHGREALAGLSRRGRRGSVAALAWRSRCRPRPGRTRRCCARFPSASGIVEHAAEEVRSPTARRSSRASRSSL